jgi:predicted DsbA family dithiol-disulfide isomerase
MLVEVWSDIVCPWCYIGKRRLERALDRLPDRAAVTVRFRSFELDPTRGPDTGESLDRMLASKYGVSLEEAQAMNDRVTGLAADEGVAFRLDIARPGNTFDAHRLSHLARAAGREAEVMERLQAGYFTEGVRIGDGEALGALAMDAGLDAHEVEDTLSTDRFAAEVREDEAHASRLGIRGVPFFVFDRRLGVSGAQEADVLLDALRRAHADGLSEPVVAPA